MKYYQLENGDKVPALGLGTWKSEPGQVYEAVKKAIEIGYRHIDCAPIYGNEKEIGKAIKEAINDGEVKREELWITSKLWNNAHYSDDVLPALRKTLEDLQLDYLDLYLIHWPVSLKKGVNLPSTGEDFLSLEEVPLLETWRGMQRCASENLCKHIGVSNFSQKKLAHIVSDCSLKPEFNQVECHPFLQQQSLLEYCRQQNILLTAYSPLGSKDRPAFLKKEAEPNLLEHSVIKKIVEKTGRSPAQILLSWALQRGTIVIPKSVNYERMMENFYSQNITLEAEDIQAINSLEMNYRFVDGSFWTMPGSSYTLANLWD